MYGKNINVYQNVLNNILIIQIVVMAALIFTKVIIYAMNVDHKICLILLDN